jgi:hypothetical protein
MAIMEGWRGSVYLGGDKIAELNHWRANLDGGITQKTAFGDQAHARCYTIKDIDGNFSGNYDNTDTNGQLAIIDMFLNGGSLADIFLYLYVSGSDGLYGNALVTPSVEVETTGIDSFDCGFVGDGLWSRADLSA